MIAKYLFHFTIAQREIQDFIIYIILKEKPDGVSCCE